MLFKSYLSNQMPACTDVTRYAAKPFDSMNGIAAMMLLNMTSSVRFEGSLNVDLNDITMNLVPFPKVKGQGEGSR
jgi:hypothetical protein